MGGKAEGEKKEGEKRNLPVKGLAGSENSPPLTNSLLLGYVEGREKGGGKRNLHAGEV